MPATYGEIVIEGTVIPLNSLVDFPVSLVLSIDEIANPSKLVGFSGKRSAKIPSTESVVKFFDMWEHAQRKNPDAAKFKDFWVEVNGVPVMRGKAQLSSVKTRGVNYWKKGLVHAINLFANNADWFDQLRTVRVRDVEYSVATFSFTQPAIIAGTNAVDADTHDYGFLLAAWVPWVNTTWVTYAEHTPFVFVKPIIDWAFNSIGYTLESEFFESDYFKRLIIPLGWIGPKYSIEWSRTNVGLQACTATTQVIPAATTQIINYEVVEYGDAHFPSPFNTYTAPFNGVYFVTGYVNGYQTPTGPPATFNFGDLYKNGGFQALANNISLLLAAGDTLDIRWTQGAGNSFTVVGGCFEIDFIPFQTIPPTFGDLVAINELIPADWLMTDLILGLTHAYGLMWDTDTYSDNIIVEPKDRWTQKQNTPTKDTISEDGYYLDNYAKFGRDAFQPEVWDITPLLDLNKEGQLVAMNNQRRFARMCWKEDSADQTLAELNRLERLPGFCGEYDKGSDRFKESVELIENPFFAPTLMAFFNDGEGMHATSTKVPAVPLFWPVDFLNDPLPTTANYEIGPRLLYWAGRRGTDGLFDRNNGSTYNYPFAFFVNHGDITNGFDPSLSFGDEPLITGGGDFVRGLINVFHIREFKRLSVGKLLKDYFVWSEVDILGWSFRRKILHDDLRWIVKKIDGYKPIQKQSTKTELILDCPAELADQGNIISSTVPTFVGNPYPDGECMIDAQLSEMLVSCDYVALISNPSSVLVDDSTTVDLTFDFLVTNTCTSSVFRQPTYPFGRHVIRYITSAARQPVTGAYIQEIRVAFYRDFTGPPGSGTVVVNDFTIDSCILAGNTLADFESWAQCIQDDIETQIFNYSIPDFGTGAMNGEHYILEVYVDESGAPNYQLAIQFTSKHYPDGLWIGMDWGDTHSIYSDDGTVPSQVPGVDDMSVFRGDDDVYQIETEDVGCDELLAIIRSNGGYLDPSNFWEFVIDATPSYQIFTHGQIYDSNTVDLQATCSEREVTVVVTGCAGAPNILWFVDFGFGPFLHQSGGTQIWLQEGATVRVDVDCDANCFATDELVVADP